MPEMKTVVKMFESMLTQPATPTWTTTTSPAPAAGGPTQTWGWSGFADDTTPAGTWGWSGSPQV